ncbi:MAG: cyclic nucleotide-binding domain-containing protein [Actinomycetota bacterium]
MLRRKDHSRRDALRAISLFSTLPDKTLNALAEAGRDVRHLPGQTIVKEGGMGIGFHVIVSGECAVSVGGDQVASIRAGQFFGEMALLENAPRNATVSATTEVLTFSMDGPQFKWLLERHPEVEERINEVARERKNN